MNYFPERIIFLRPDGQVSSHAIRMSAQREGETKAECLSREIAKVLVGLKKNFGETTAEVGIVDETELPYADPGDTTEVEDYMLDETTQIVSREVVEDKTRHHRGCYRWNGSAVVVDAVLEAEARWATIRAIRDKLLTSSDGIMAREVEQGGPNQVAIKVYRQTLRNLPQDNSDPNFISWPTKP